MMEGRTFVVGTVTLLAGARAAEAQQTDKVYRVGYVSFGAHPTQHGIWHTLLEAMRERNYVEGRTSS